MLQYDPVDKIKTIKAIDNILKVDTHMDLPQEEELWRGYSGHLLTVVDRRKKRRNGEFLYFEEKAGVIETSSNDGLKEGGKKRLLEG